MLSVPDLVIRAAAWHGPRVAVDDGHRQLTFTEVDERSNRLANAMVGLSPLGGSRVAVLTGNRAEVIEIDFAVAKSGKVRVPINVRLTEHEVRYVIEDSQADILVTSVEYADRAEAWSAETDTLKTVIVIGGDQGFGHDYESVLAAADARPPGVLVAPDAGSFILYTSGTTGRPKGALATQSSRLHATSAMLRDELDVPVGGGMVHAGSMAHGSGSKVLAYFVRGARNIPMAKWDPAEFLSIVEQKQATGSFVVPTMLAGLVEATKSRRPGRSSLRSLTYGGAPISPALFDEAVDVFGDALVQVYGSCEAPHPVLVMTGAEHVLHRRDGGAATPVGRETFECEVRLVGDDGQDVVGSGTGEIWIKGPTVMAGYWNKPEATAAAFDGEWYRSGDVARRDHEGFYLITDRTRDVIISGGLNVYPAEVENALTSHSAVAGAAVVGVPDPTWGEAVKAYVVLKRGESVSADQLVEHARSTLAGYKKPSSVEFLDELPLGSTGKVLRRELRERNWGDNERKV